MEKKDRNAEEKEKNFPRKRKEMPNQEKRISEDKEKEWIPSLLQSVSSASLKKNFFSSLVCKEKKRKEKKRKEKKRKEKKPYMVSPS